MSSVPTISPHSSFLPSSDLTFDFFNRYHNAGKTSKFTHNPSISPKSNFEVLATCISWSASSRHKSRTYTRFLHALNETNLSNAENKLAVWFASNFPEFDYDERWLYELLRDTSASNGKSGQIDQKDFEKVWLEEFESLVEYRGWKVGGPKSKKARKEFEDLLRDRVAKEFEIPKLNGSVNGDTHNSNAPNPESQKKDSTVVEEVETREDDQVGRETKDTKGKGKKIEVTEGDSSTNSTELTQEALHEDDEVNREMVDTKGKGKKIEVNEGRSSRNSTELTQEPLPTSSVEIDFSEPSPLDQFFRQFHFSYDPNASSAYEYDRMSEELEWDENDYHSNLEGYYTQLREEFLWQLSRPRDLKAVREAARARRQQLANAPELLASGKLSKRARKRLRLLVAQSEQQAQEGQALPTVMEENEETEDGDLLDAYNIGNLHKGSAVLMEGWKRLCKILGLRTPEFEVEAPMILITTWINIFDFIDAMKSDTVHKLTRFKSLKDLADYSYASGKIYPMLQAQNNAILQYLLRKLSTFKPASYKRGKKGKKDSPNRRR